MSHNRDSPERKRQNGSHDWDKFDPDAYHALNYESLRDDDRQIIEKVRDFFASSNIEEDARGVDVGAGSNLYPTLGMLPFCRSVDLLEYSAANVRWLRRKRFTLWLRLDRKWDKFWQTYLQNPVYRRVAGGRRPYWSFLRKARVRRASVFDLPKDTYDVGTMFFVACSLSTDLVEFHLAVECFGRSLKKGAPFAIAFMTNSNGYMVADRWFPAVPINEDDIKLALKDIGLDAKMKIEEIDTVDPLRPDVGMVLATGRA